MRIPHYCKSTIGDPLGNACLFNDSPGKTQTYQQRHDKLGPKTDTSTSTLLWTIPAIYIDHQKIPNSPDRFQTVATHQAPRNTMPPSLSKDKYYTQQTRQSSGIMISTRDKDNDDSNCCINIWLDTVCHLTFKCVARLLPAYVLVCTDARACDGLEHNASGTKRIKNVGTRLGL